MKYLLDLDVWKANGITLLILILLLFTVWCMTQPWFAVILITVLFVLPCGLGIAAIWVSVYERVTGKQTRPKRGEWWSGGYYD